MREQINKLARGEFEYEVPQMTLSDSRLSFSVAQGKDYKGSFKLTSDSRAVKGVCYCDNDRVVIEDSGFQGVENVIRYKVLTDGFVPEDTITGNFYIVADAGEMLLPFCFKIVQENIQTAMGNINNLFHFANLVQTEPNMASKLFMSDEFEKIFLSRTGMLSAVYRMLKTSSDTYLAMEEFLIVAGKKRAVNIQTSNLNRKYEKISENVSDTIVINKDSWGYFELEISSDCDFICPSKNKISSAEFAGNRYELDYIIDYNKMHAGKNYGRITISTYRQKLEVEVTAWQELKDVSAKLRQDENTLLLYNKYLNFRSRKISYKDWLDTTTDTAQQLIDNDSRNYFAGMVLAQCRALQNEKESAKAMLEEIHGRIMDSSNYEVLYCYYLYVISLMEEDETVYEKLLSKVNELYAANPANWRIFWVLMHMDSTYEQNKSMKLAQIKSLFYKKMSSPVMYYEAVSVLNEQPYFLRVLDDFEIQVITFACKRGMIGKNLLGQICDLCSEGKFGGKKILMLLERLYRLTNSDRVLELLCSLIIRMQLSDKKYINILTESINHGFRIAGLYESYMEMLPEDYYEILPRTVRLYFSYNNALDAGKRALLYANIIVNKERDRETYNSYIKIIEQFCYEQLELGNINSNLAIIYKEFAGDALYLEKYAKQAVNIVFANRFKCSQAGIDSVCICHKELMDSERIALVNGVGYGSVYTQDCGIVFMDSFGRCFCGSVEYERQQLFDEKFDYDRLYEASGADNYFFGVYMAQNIIEKRCKVNNAQQILEEIYEHAPLVRDFKREVAKNIAAYYYEKYSGNEFDSIYDRLTKAGILEDLTSKEYTYLIETCIAHSMESAAKELIECFGAGMVYPEKLLRLCLMLTDSLDGKEDAELVQLCHKCFVSHKYEEKILEYLSMYYNGPTKEMIKLWEACLNFQIETWGLEERILGQMLFTHSTSTKMDDIFASYNSSGAKERMVEAYLGYHCYNYFVHKIIIPVQVVELVEARLNYSKDEMLVEKLALIKYYSDANKLTDKQLLLCTRLMEELCAQNIYFGFYKKLIGKIPVPMAVLDKSYIEYRTNPKCRVMLHYMIEGGESRGRFIEQEMTHVCYGIFVKELTLFYGDCAQYYIVEKNGDSEIITESHTLTNDKINPLSSQGRFDCINDLLSCQDLKDFVTLRKLLNSYIVKDCASEQLFKPMD